MHNRCARISSAIALGIATTLGTAALPAAAQPSLAGNTMATLPTPGKGCVWISDGYSIQRVNMRSRPSKNATRIAIIPAFTDISWLEECPQRGYVRAVYNGKLGWVYSTEVGYGEQAKPVIYLYPPKETK